MELEKKSDDTRLVEEVLMPRTEELLVCSSSNDVLLQWQCGQPEARIDFMNYLQEKALQLARSFGAFDRLEIKGDDFHVVARVKNDSRMFFRLHRPPQISG